MKSKDGRYPAECPSRKAITVKGKAWWYLGTDACHFHRDDGTWITVHTHAIRKALATLDRQMKRNES